MWGLICEDVTTIDIDNPDATSEVTNLSHNCFHVGSNLITLFTLPEKHAASKHEVNMMF